MYSVADKVSQRFFVVGALVVTPKGSGSTPPLPEPCGDTEDGDVEEEEEVDDEDKDEEDDEEEGEIILEVSGLEFEDGEDIDDSVLLLLPLLLPPISFSSLRDSLPLSEIGGGIELESSSFRGIKHTKIADILSPLPHRKDNSNNRAAISAGSR